MQAREMIVTHPDVKGSVSEALITCIQECYSCAQTCTSCADACLAEKSVDRLKQCIRLNLDCADICDMTAALASRRTGSNEKILRETLELCEAACRACEEECRRHADRHDHCRICADACRSCADACREAMADVG